MVSSEIWIKRFKGAIVSEKVAIWTADDITIDVTQPSVDVKEITLRPSKAGGAPTFSPAGRAGTRQRR